MIGRSIKPLSALLLLSLASLAGCSGGSSSGGGSSSSSGGVAMCNNLPQANGVIGQLNFTAGAPNTGGVSGSTLDAPQGPLSANGTSSYLADTGNNRVLGFSGTPTGVAGAASFIIGQPDAQTVSSGSGPVSGSPIKFSAPAKVSVGGTYLVVADSGNNRVLIWNKLPTANTAPDVVLGQPDLSSSDANHPAATVSASSLSNPTAAIISNGQLLVVDKGNNRVLIWNTVPTTNNTLADVELGQIATNSAGVENCTANSGSAGYCFATNNPASDTAPQGASFYVLGINSPSDAWTDGAHLLFSDTGNHRVLFWGTVPTVNNKLADNVIGYTQFGQNNQTGGAGVAGLHSPWGLTSDGVNLFVGDTGNNRVLEFANYLGTPSNGTSANYVFGQADFTHTQQNDPDQNNQVGDQSHNPATDGITAGTMSSPLGVFANSSNDLFVTDSGNSRVLHFAASSGVDGSEPYIPCGI